MDMIKIDEISKYFESELNKLDEQMNEVDYIYDIIKNEAENLAKKMKTPQKGLGRYTTETFQNLITVASQKQSLMKDKFTLKKTIIDLSLKDKDKSEADEANFLDIIKNIKSKL